MDNDGECVGHLRNDVSDTSAGVRHVLKTPRVDRD